MSPVKSPEAQFGQGEGYKKNSAKNLSTFAIQFQAAGGYTTDARQRDSQVYFEERIPSKYSFETLEDPKVLKMTIDTYDDYLDKELNNQPSTQHSQNGNL